MSKRHRIAQNGSECFKMAQKKRPKGTEWHRMSHIASKWPRKKHPKGTEWHRMASKRHRMILNGSEKHPKGTEWHRMAKNASK